MTSQSPAAEPAAGPSLRQRATRGVMWVAAQAMLSRGVVLVQQLALAWLLAKSDFGLIGLTYTVTTFVTLMANPGIDAVLVRRSRRFRRWATPAFWLGLTMSVNCAIVTLLFAAPLAAGAYDEPRLLGLIAVLAIALPIQSLQIVPRAQLQFEMRFKAVAGLSMLDSLLTAALTIAAACLGMGAYSFVVPVPIVSAVVGAAAWWLARPPIRLRPEFSRWKYLFFTSAPWGVTQLLYVLENQADYIALGLAGLADATIGTYVFAFSIAVQPQRLLSGNIPVVLFPSLSHLSLEPEKQVRAGVRAMRLLTLLIVPLCGLQIMVTDPIFRLFFPPRWLDAVLPCQILTFGLMINSFCWPANSLMMAQGRFRELLVVAAIGSFVLVLFLGGVMWLCPDIVAVAIAVTCWHFLTSPFLHWVATHRYDSHASYARETFRPLAAAGLATIPCVLLQANLPETIVGNAISLVGGGAIFAGAYLLLIYLLAPVAMRDLHDQLAPLWAKLRRSTT